MEVAQCNIEERQAVAAFFGITAHIKAPAYAITVGNIEDPKTVPAEVTDSDVEKAIATMSVDDDEDKADMVSDL